VIGQVCGRKCNDHGCNQPRNNRSGRDHCRSFTHTADQALGHVEFVMTKLYRSA
jgi:hypothetical protein